jgi:hypothetical protein
MSHVAHAGIALAIGVGAGLLTVRASSVAKPARAFLRPAEHGRPTITTTLGRSRADRDDLSGNVINLPLRQPAMLARAAASLDRLSGGRFELGPGAGGFGTGSKRWAVRGARLANPWTRWRRRSTSPAQSKTPVRRWIADLRITSAGAIFSSDRSCREPCELFVGSSVAHRGAPTRELSTR